MTGASGLPRALTQQLAARVEVCCVCYFPHWMCLCEYFHPSEVRFTRVRFDGRYPYPLLESRLQWRVNPFVPFREVPLSEVLPVSEVVHE